MKVMLGALEKHIFHPVLNQGNYQRRGRLLRHPRENLSTIYDFIVLPQDTFRDTLQVLHKRIAKIC